MKSSNDTFYKNNVPFSVGIISGALIGFISGIVGIGGGVFLSPLLILLRWVEPKKTAAISAIFIFINSLSGLLARFIKYNMVLPQTSLMMLFAIVVIAGGYIGSYFASLKLKISILKKLWVLHLL